MNTFSTLLNFVLIPYLCALFASFAAAPLGCVLGWRRLVYFGEALSHSSLLGIALSLYFQFPLTYGVWLTSILLVGLLFAFNNQKDNASNILGSLSHIALALGLILITRLEHIRTDLLGYLYGNILATTASDLITITVVSAVTLFLLKLIWQKIILITLNPSIAYCEIKHCRWIELAFLIVLSGYIATMVQYFGLLLVVSLLIIPANAANRLSRTPEESAIKAAIIAVISATIGTGIAWFGHFALEPSIIVVAGILYFAAVFYTRAKKNR